MNNQQQQQLQGGPPQGGHLQHQGGFNQPPHHVGGPNPPGGLNQPPHAGGGLPPLGGFNQPPPGGPYGGYQAPFNYGVYGQAPPYPQGGVAMGAFPPQAPPGPPHGPGAGNANQQWLGPHSWFHANISDPKQRRQVAEGVKKRIIHGVGGGGKYDGSPVQPSQGSTISAKTNPLMFQEVVINAFNQESGGALSPPTDQMTHHPRTGQDIVHPQADALSSMRIEILFEFFPQGLGVVTTYNSSRGQEMLIHDLRGGKRSVPHGLVTLRDVLRLFLEEEGRKHATRFAAAQAFNDISVGSRESWLAAANRLALYFRAMMVDPEFPPASEDPYVWALLTATQLEILLEKTIELCIESDMDRSEKRAQLAINKDLYTPQLQAMPIVRQELGLPPMNNRGECIKNIHSRFSNKLAQDAGKFAPQRKETSKPSSRQAEVHSLKSNKMPLTMRLFPGMEFSQPTQRAALCAIQTLKGDKEVDDILDGQLAAAEVHQERNPRKRTWEDQDSGAQRGPRPRRNYHDHQPAARMPEQRGSTATFSPGKRGNDDRSQGEGHRFKAGNNRFQSDKEGHRFQGSRPQGARRKAMPQGELPAEAPKADGSPEEIQRYIRANGVCFYHARGQPCPSMRETGCCPYSHAPSPIYWGAYPRQASQQRTSQMEREKREQAQELMAIQDEQLGYQHNQEDPDFDDSPDSQTELTADAPGDDSDPHN